MKHLSALLLMSSALGCEARHQPPNNSPTTHIPENAPRRSYSDQQLFQCVADSSLQEHKRFVTGLKYRLAWTESMMPLMDQFYFTPWAEIPELAQEQVKTMQADLRRQALAEEAIKQRVPVSQLPQGCHPKFPHCLDPSHPDNQEQIGRLYHMVLSESLESFIRASAASSGQDIELVGTHLNPQLSYLDSSTMIHKAIVDENRKWQVSIAKFKAFISLLPRSAVLPNMKWPEVESAPTSCQGLK